VDHHFLTPLFAPRSIVVFSGSQQPPSGDPADAHEAGLPHLARALRESLNSSGFPKEAITWLDIGMTGRLQDLADAGADLALIALPNDQVEDALEVAGRIRCRAALVLSTGLPANTCAALHRVAQRYGVHLLGPNSMGFQRPSRPLNASALGPMAQAGSLGLVSQSGARHARLGAHAGRGFFHSGVAGAEHLGRPAAGAGLPGQ